MEALWQNAGCEKVELRDIITICFEGKNRRKIIVAKGMRVIPKREVIKERRNKIAEALASK